MNNPVSTYRLQFHKNFSFQDFEHLISYFGKLGIGTIYASPILASTTGSTHGYDGVDPGKIDPEIGNLDKLLSLTTNLRELGIGWLQDIVPNHMAFHTENSWLMDALEKGRQSTYAKFFDISWNDRLFHGKVMVPFLSREIDEMIDDGDVKIIYDDARLKLNVEGQAFPLNLRSYLTILNVISDKSQALLQLVDQLEEINGIEDTPTFSSRWDEWLLQLRSLYANDLVKPAVDAALENSNADQRLLKELVDGQHYKFCHWQCTEEQINFRRFFTVNGLICLNMQDEIVFEKYHALIKQLTGESIFQGIRIDHIDGLLDPSGYLDRLREHVGSGTYVIAEKILGGNEDLPARWPIQGTTGYEFLAVVNNLLTDPAAEEHFTTFYTELIGDNRPARELLLSKKSEILYGHMGGELDNLFGLFVELELADADSLEKIGREPIREVIAEFLIHCPVYRYYASAMPLSEAEARGVKEILTDINKHHLELSPAVEVLEQCFIHRPALNDADYNRRAAEFYQRCMQFTGPLMAKGGEDTLMYTYNRFIGHNEVGDFPDRFGMSVSDFHQYMKKRKKDWPLALNATSTHDTKRGEDVRARLNVLTERADEWFEKVKEWQKLNAEIRQPGEGPDANDEYLIYQTIVGAYPMLRDDPDDFTERLKEYLQKALREAKTKSSWSEPNEAYEKQVSDFVGKILIEDAPFGKSLHRFLDSIVDFGIINSLAQLTLKFTCPGVPDVYQGCELWDLSLVDPDNRRKVDFGKRKEWLEELENYETERLLEKLWETRRGGQVKLWLTQRLSVLRRQNRQLFAQGEYLPLKVRGTYKNHVLAFVRRYKRDVLVTVVPLHTASLCHAQNQEFFALDWRDTHVVLPETTLPEWDNVLTENKAAFQGKLPLTDLFKDIPIAILKGERADNERRAGVLLHITSLPSPFGIGDIGPAAFQFADFLEKTSQKIWQVLPLNPTAAAQGNSPYAALSSRAGNPLLISPETLANEDLLSPEELSKYHLPDTSVVDFEAAARNKYRLLEKLFHDKQEHLKESNGEMAGFVQKNEAWLDDFALYMVLKKRFANQPWYTWPGEFRRREKNALDRVREEEDEQMRFIKWQQYLFDKQWKALRGYCNERDIRLFGDIPFYVSYDSVDVWANPELFCVDQEGRVTGMAGVPPDAFSEDGQLWGMPVFDWNEMKAQDYKWWFDRLARNIEMFDVIRLDHFRAFTDYWQVPGGEETAVNGAWKPGPGEDFFRKAATKLGDLPFVAEDLGEMNPEVYVLRDQFKLPGMKVLQFAFDETMPESAHIPHHYSPNFLAYTGTHDNNTTKGWFRQMTDAGMRERLAAYLGKAVSEDNIAHELGRLAYGSVAGTAILPIQDILNLDESAKMNLPGSNDNNWAWRLLPGQIDDEAVTFLTTMTALYDRE